MTGDQGDGDDNHVDALLDELAVLRSLDRLRRALPVGSAGHAIAVRQIERRSRALINRFREFRPERRDAGRRRRG